MILRFIKAVAAVAIGFGVSAGAGVSTTFAQDQDACDPLLAEPPLILDPDLPNPSTVEIRGIVGREVIGQEEGLVAVTDAIGTSLTGLQDPKRPRGRLLLTGPTGVGKTETIRAQIKALGGDPDFHLIRIDCGELQMGHEISRLIGATASYVGYGDTPLLSKTELEKRRLKIQTPTGEFIDVNFLLIDEIEECHPSIYNFLLGILDNGKATMGDNSETFFRDSFIYATSNLGSQEADRLIKEKAAYLDTIAPATRQHFGPAELDLTGRFDLDLRKKISDAQKLALSQKFQPKFLNRWSHIIQYLHLSKTEYSPILTKMMAQLQMRIFEHGIIKAAIVMTDAAEEKVLASGTNFLNGARELERTIERMITVPLSRMISSQQMLEGDVIEIDGPIGENSPSLTFRVLGRGYSRPELLKAADTFFPGFNLLNAPFAPPKETAAQVAEAKYETLLSKLKKSEPVRKRLWSDSNTPSIHLTGRSEDGGEMRVPSKYIRIGDDLYLLKLTGSKEIQIQQEREMPDFMKGKVKDEQIHRWTEDEVLKLLSGQKT